ncbi:MAG: SDR family NAD(P)-dependent oxidoreductase [Proteobacteria bacterium]|nr:SDR family NAD(P)-dependent oxidoreductase [Pseudomonadota bacterium]
MAKRLEGKIALVTGASRGLGYDTALHLAREGAHVVATARTKAGLEELDDAIRAVGSTATLVPMDIRDFEAIDRLGAAIFERWKKLDVLIGNAGILGKLTPLPQLDLKVWDDVMKITVDANFRLIRSMDPLLRMADHGRAIFLTSGKSYKTIAYWGAYSIPRAALECMMRIYAAEMETTTVRVNCFSPGPVRTDLRAQALPGEDPLTVPTAEEVMAQIIPMCLPEFTDNGSVYKYGATGLYRQYGPHDLQPKE